MAIPVALAAVVPAIVEAVTDLIPNKKEAAKAKQQIEKILIENIVKMNVEQAKTNQVEAQHRSLWVAGWRPAIGWCCAVGLSWAFLGHPLAEWLYTISGYPEADIPEVRTDILMELTLAMLGMAGLRTFEKSRGLTR